MSDAQEAMTFNQALTLGDIVSHKFVELNNSGNGDLGWELIRLSSSAIQCPTQPDSWVGDVEHPTGQTGAAVEYMKKVVGFAIEHPYKAQQSARIRSHYV